MTTKQITKETKVCDVCGTDEHVYTACVRCGRDYCYECSKSHVVQYHHGVHFSGSGDGDYCLVCDCILAKSGKDKLHTAYLKIRQLRAEESGWYADFKIRGDAAEEEIRKLRGATE